MRLCCKQHAVLLLLLANDCSLISDDLRKGLMDRAEHTFRIALTLAVLAGFVMMLFMEVSQGQECHVQSVGAQLQDMGQTS